MKICWDNLEGLRLSKNGYFIKNNNSILVYKDSCCKCNDPYLTSKYAVSEFCSQSCAMKDKKFSKKHRESLSKNNGMSKGGVWKLKLPLYKTYGPQIEYAEEIRPFIDDNNRELLQVRCSKCGSWFVPGTYYVQSRIRALKGDIWGECRFYCSDTCKSMCEVFGKNPYSFIDVEINNNLNLPYNSKELRVWSKEVLKRAKYKCEICGKKAEHAHHIQPKKLEPGYALDPDNGLAVCTECHYKYGHSDDCSTGAISHKQC